MPSEVLVEFANLNAYRAAANADSRHVAVARSVASRRGDATRSSGARVTGVLIHTLFMPLRREIAEDNPLRLDERG